MIIFPALHDQRPVLKACPAKTRFHSVLPRLPYFESGNVLPGMTSDLSSKAMIHIPYAIHTGISRAEALPCHGLFIVLYWSTGGDQVNQSMSVYLQNPTYLPPKAMPGPRPYLQEKPTS